MTDRELLRNKAAGRRSNMSEAEQAEQLQVKKASWSCSYCVRDFTFEKSFMNHRCKERDRIDELRSVIGIAAYAHYSEWMRAKKRSVPPIETFGASQYYSTFIKFAEHAVKTHIPNTQQFIKLMVQHNDVSPSLWTRDNVYAMYLQYFDTAHPPEAQVIESIDFALDLVSEFETTKDELFKAIPIGTLITYIKKRKLSPWFLMASKTFRDHLMSLPSDQKDRIERAMNLSAMISHIRQNSDVFEFFNRATIEAGL